MLNLILRESEKVKVQTFPLTRLDYTTLHYTSWLYLIWMFFVCESGLPLRFDFWLNWTLWGSCGCSLSVTTSKRSMLLLNVSGCPIWVAHALVRPPFLYLDKPQQNFIKAGNLSCKFMIMITHANDYAASITYVSNITYIRTGQNVRAQSGVEVFSMEKMFSKFSNSRLHQALDLPTGSTGGDHLLFWSDWLALDRRWWTDGSSNNLPSIFKLKKKEFLAVPFQMVLYNKPSGVWVTAIKPLKF